MLSERKQFYKNFYSYTDMYFYFERLHASNLTTEIVKSTRQCPAFYKKRRLLFTFCCALNHQKIGAQQLLPRVNYLSGKKVDKFDSKSDFSFLKLESIHCAGIQNQRSFLLFHLQCVYLFICVWTVDSISL